jgi:ferredoxin
MTHSDARRPVAPKFMRRPAVGPTTETRLRVDPVACEGIGLCAHLAASIVELDRWGYPVIAGEALARPEIGDARSAVRGCPRRALWLETTPRGSAGWS